MSEIQPSNQIKLFGLDRFIKNLINLDTKNILPNKILLSGQKGLGKSTLAYHFINYILSKDEDFKYNIDKLEINPNNRSYKTVLNGSNPNLYLLDIASDKKNIDINQVRDLIHILNKSSFNKKPRFVLIDNIEFLNINASNALLKVIEEPNFNIYFILINNSKKILPTLLSRCIDFKIFLSNNNSILVTNKLLNGNLDELINNDLINHYSTPGNIYNLFHFAKKNGYDLNNLDLKSFINLILINNHYKKDNFIKFLVFDLIETYFRKVSNSYSSIIFDKYSYFLKRISTTKKFNLDEESLFIEFQREIFNG